MIHKAKKSLGQNFLKSKLALSQIVYAGEINEKDIVLEIGPGKGALTEELLVKAKKVIAIEKDSDLTKFLREKFQKEIEIGKLVLVEGDVLDANLINKYLPKIKYKLIANIPYNITGAIFKNFLSVYKQPSIMVLLVQKEVAERAVARDKKESILSLSIKAYGKPEYISKVSKKYFSPSPKVDSAILKVGDISKKSFKNKKEEDKFFNIIKTAFAHKRKIAIKNLEKIADKEKLKNIFDKLEISLEDRAENIKIDQWVDISKSLTIVEKK